LLVAGGGSRETELSYPDTQAVDGDGHVDVLVSVDADDD
jgi:hypothetical protein